jgi:hypothetical protein
MTSKYTNLALMLVVFATTCSQEKISATKGCTAKLTACLRRLCGRNSAPVTVAETLATDAALAAPSAVIAHDNAVAAVNVGSGSVSIRIDPRRTTREAWTTPPARRLPRVSSATEDEIEQALNDATSPHSPVPTIATPPPASALTTETGVEFSAAHKAQLAKAIEERKEGVAMIQLMIAGLAKDSTQTFFDLIKQQSLNTIATTDHLSLQSTCAKLDATCMQIAGNMVQDDQSIKNVKLMLTAAYAKHLEKLIALQRLCAA